MSFHNDFNGFTPDADRDRTEETGTVQNQFGHAESFTDKAKRIVMDHYNVQALANGTNILQPYDIYVVWFSKTLQNWKALVSTDMHDGLYYEVTHNGDKKETYLDVYQKVSNTLIPDSTEDI